MFIKPPEDERVDPIPRPPGIRNRRQRPLGGREERPELAALVQIDRRSKLGSGGFVTFGERGAHLDPLSEIGDHSIR